MTISGFAGYQTFSSRPDSRFPEGPSVKGMRIAADFLESTGEVERAARMRAKADALEAASS